MKSLWNILFWGGVFLAFILSCIFYILVRGVEIIFGIDPKKTN